MSTTTPHVAVVGAGPGGLTLARVLQRHGVDVTVHEHDTHEHAREQGGTLDMQRDTGQVALTEAGLLEDFFARSRPEGQDQRVVAKDGTLIEEEIADPQDRFKPEIDRGALRGLLLGSLEPGTVRWGETVREIRPAGDGRHTLVVDGPAPDVTADLVVGADGAWSRVRPLVSDAVPRYSGVWFVELRIADADAAHPEIAALVGRGGMFAAADAKGLIAQRQGDGSIRVYAGFRADPEWGAAAGLSQTGPVYDDAGAVRAELHRRFAGWAPSLLAIVDECTDEITGRGLYALPVPHVWTATPGVTLIGDAAHLMSPFSGLGANTAMLDGAELARAVAEGPDVATAVARYERTMLPRAAANAVGAATGLDGFFSEERPAA